MVQQKYMFGSRGELISAKHAIKLHKRPLGKSINLKSKIFRTYSMAASVMMATPLTLNPPLLTDWNRVAGKKRTQNEPAHVLRVAPLQHESGTKKEPKPKLLSPDIFWWGGGLPREGVGAKKFGMSLETQGIKLFWRDIPGFCRDIPEAPEKFEKKKGLCSIFVP